MAIVEIGIFGLVIAGLVGLLFPARENLKEAQGLKDEAESVAESCEKVVEHELSGLFIYMLFRTSISGGTQKADSEMIRRMSFEEFKQQRETWFGDFKINEEDWGHIRMLAELSGDLESLSESMSQYVKAFSDAQHAGILAIVITILEAITYFVFFVPEAPISLEPQTLGLLALLSMLVVAIGAIEGWQYVNKGLLLGSKNTTLRDAIGRLKKSETVEDIEELLPEVYKIAEEI